MAVTFPVKYTPVDDLEVAYPGAVDEDVVRKLIQNCNLIARLSPIGTIRAFALNQTGVQAPDPNMWQLCDGSEITNPSSPLRSIGILHNFTPNLAGKFIRGAADTISNGTGGTTNIGISHNHGGQTGNFAPGFVGDGDIQVPSMHNHTHGISDDLGSKSDVNPANQSVALYLKINL